MKRRQSPAQPSGRDGRQGARVGPSREKRKEMRKGIAPKAEEDKIDQGPMKYGSNKWCKSHIENLTSEVEGLKQSLAYQQQQNMAMQSQAWNFYNMQAQAQANFQAAAMGRKARSPRSSSSGTKPDSKRPAKLNLEKVPVQEEESSLSSSSDDEVAAAPQAKAPEQRLETQPDQPKEESSYTSSSPEKEDVEPAAAEPAAQAEPAAPAEQATTVAEPASPAAEPAAPAAKPAA